jgi:dihydrofolate reductase
MQGRERRTMLLPQRSHQLAGAFREPFRQRDEQGVFGSEPLHEHGRGDTGLPGNGCERQLAGADAIHDGVGGGEQLLVGDLSWAGAHRDWTISKRSDSIISKYAFSLTLLDLATKGETLMRTVTYGGAVSLDGFLAGADGSLDWLHFSKDVEQVIAAYWKDVDTILMGRKTYVVAAAQTGSSRPRAKRAGNRKPKAPSMRTYVFSRTLEAIDQPGVELVRGDAVAFVRDLKERPGRKICLMGGGELAQSLLGAGLVDEVGLNIHPILLGAGVPVFRDPGHRVKLTLTECRPIDGGCILATYAVA